MCGRFALYSDTALPPRYNIGPGQEIATLRALEKERSFAFAHWGMRMSGRETLLINARAETVAEKRSFASAFRRGRCLVPADAFYEWKAGQPYCVRRADRAPFMMAALWRGEGGGDCVIITTEANKVLRPIHHRMPVMLEERHWAAWLGEMAALSDLRSFLRPLADDAVEAYPVSRHVNSVRHDSPDLLKPLPLGAIAEQASLL